MNQFAKLRLAVEDALEEARKKKAAIQDAVNWGDLRCSSIEKVVNEQGDEYYRVWIEEVAPDAARFKEFIYQHLLSKGFMEVLVNTEW